MDVGISRMALHCLRQTWLSRPGLLKAFSINPPGAEWDAEQMWLLCLLAHLLMATGGQVTHCITSWFACFLTDAWFFQIKISSVTLVWTCIPTACPVCTISNETLYHVHTLLLSLPKHSTPPVILPSLKTSISRWIRNMWCVVQPALMLWDLLLPSADVFTVSLHFPTLTGGLEYKSQPDFGFVSVTVLAGVGFPALLCLWLVVSPPKLLCLVFGLYLTFNN